MASSFRRRGRRQSFLSIGDSRMAGRELSLARRLERLPRALATASRRLGYRSPPAIASRVLRSYAAFVPGPSITARQYQLELSRRLARYYRAERINLARVRLDPRTRLCLQRGRRREVLFSLGVSGRSWGSGGGPQMRHARRSVDSSYTCRR